MMDIMAMLEQQHEPIKPGDPTSDVTSYNFIDKLSSVYSQLLGLHNDLKELRDINNALNAIGAFMPIGLAAHMSDIPYNKDITDKSFAAALIRIEKDNQDPIQRMLAYAKLIKKIVVVRQGMVEKCNKLSERIRLQKSGTESQNAKLLRKKFTDGLRTIDLRLAKVFEKYFYCLTKSLEAIYKITDAVNALFPDGNKDLRTASLKYSSKRTLEDLTAVLDKAALGHKQGKRVGI